MANFAKTKTDSGPGAKNGKVDESKYLPELLAEKDSLDASFTHSTKLLNAEIDRIKKGEPKPEGISYLDVLNTKNIKVKERLLIPNKQFPRYNFVGKILGPQGSTIKQLQEQTGARISVLGKGSTKDKSKEEELRKTGEQKYAHLGLELHVFIEVTAPIPDAYMRMAHALEEVKKFLIPEPHEQEQFMDPNYQNGAQDGSGRGRGGPPGRGRGGPPPPGGFRGRGMMPRGGAPRGGPQRGAGMWGGPARGGPAGRGAPPTTPTRGGAAPRSRGPAPGAPRMLPPQALGHQNYQHQAPQQPKAEAYDQYGSYDESYADPAAYDQSSEGYYAQQPAQGDTEYYDYGHGEQQTQESYEGYGAQQDWGAQASQWAASGKAPSARGAKGGREHPYQRPY